VWVEPAGPEGSMLLTSRVGDWVIPVDTRNLRGHYVLSATWAPTGTVAKSRNLNLMLDDTPPEKVQIATLPDKHYRGQPLPVKVTATDLESGISKVAVFIGLPTPEGKLPEGAILFPAAETLRGSGVWVAQLPVAPDQKGATINLTAVATNG